ncbi:MAG: GNAT family N-acetyltransferase [Betaproteobacteria bacterium]
MDQHRFETTVDGAHAEAAYRRLGSTLHLVHTEVAPSLEGRGIASALVEAMLDYASTNGFKVIPQCSYVRAWMQRHPESQALLAPGTRI